VTEQRYQAVLAVISEGRAVMEVASQRSVSRRTVHRWLARYEAQGLEGLPDRSHRPERCPHQMAAEIEVRVLELRRAHRYWGARRLALELGRKKVTPAPSEWRCTGVWCLVQRSNLATQQMALTAVLLPQIVVGGQLTSLGIDNLESACTVSIPSRREGPTTLKGIGKSGRA
jgi:transposase